MVILIIVHMLLQYTRFLLCFMNLNKHPPKVGPIVQKYTVKNELVFFQDWRGARWQGPVCWPELQAPHLSELSPSGQRFLIAHRIIPQVYATLGRLPPYGKKESNTVTQGPSLWIVACERDSTS